MDECTLTTIGIDVDAFVRFVESELPTYLQCERWVREHASNLNEESINNVNGLLLNQNKPMNAVERTLLAAKHRFIGLEGSDLRDPVMFENDPDDWTCLHAQVTQGAMPPLRITDLNAAFAELIKEAACTRPGRAV